MHATGIPSKVSHHVKQMLPTKRAKPPSFYSSTEWLFAPVALLFLFKVKQQTAVDLAEHAVCCQRVCASLYRNMHICQGTGFVPWETGTVWVVHAHLCFSFPDGNVATLQLVQFSYKGYIYTALSYTSKILVPKCLAIRPNSLIPSLPLLYYTLHSLIMHFPHAALGCCRSMSMILINHVMENSEQTSLKIKPWRKPPSVTATFTHRQPCCQNTAEP